MTPTEADTLAKRIINTWRGGPPLTEWANLLEQLQAGRAGTAFIRLRDELEHAPTIARFRTAYRSVRTREDDETCEHCANDGTITGPTFERHGHTYSSAIPCPHCEHGRLAATWLLGYQDARPPVDTAPLNPSTDLFA